MQDIALSIGDMCLTRSALVFCALSNSFFRHVDLYCSRYAFSPGFRVHVRNAGIELAFQRHPGVTATKVGYTGGHVERPVYESVGTSGHAEAVAVDYDPAVTSYAALVDLFFERLGVSATTLNKAGGDEGPQYRSALFVNGPAQRATAEAAVAAASSRLGAKVVTEVTDVAPFWLAEEVHQKYLEKRGQSAAKGETETIRCYG